MSKDKRIPPASTNPMIPMPLDVLPDAICDQLGVPRGSQCSRVYLGEEYDPLVDINLEFYLRTHISRRALCRAVVATDTKVLWNVPLGGRARAEDKSNLVPADQVFVYMAGFELINGVLVYLPPNGGGPSATQTNPRLGHNEAFYYFEDGHWGNDQDRTDFQFQVKWKLQNPKKS